MIHRHMNWSLLQKKLSLHNTDYFKNHDKVGKFPWSIYHQPLEKELEDFLKKIQSNKNKADILVIGCGLMNEMSILPKTFNYTLADIDKRVVNYWLEKENINYNYFCKLLELNENFRRWENKYDAIYAKEVIEHIGDWKSYLVNIKNVLKPGGKLWLSTPNYGESILPFLENSILEIIARKNGFSRKNIHPSKFSKSSLRNGLRTAGFKNIKVKLVWNRLAIVGTCEL